MRLSEDKNMSFNKPATRFIVMALRFNSIAQIRIFLILGLFILGFACAKPQQTVLAKPPQSPSGSSQAESAAGTEAPSPQIVFKATTLKIGWPAPAPDGSALIFSGHDGQRWSLYRLKIGTHKPEPLTAGLKRHATRPVYSHDGR